VSSDSQRYSNSDQLAEESILLSTLSFTSFYLSEYIDTVKIVLYRFSKNYFMRKGLHEAAEKCVSSDHHVASAGTTL